MSNHYCILDARSMKIAKEELNEDPEQKEGQLQTFKDWINERQWLKLPTDDFFLLGILRSTKFCQLRARERAVHIAKMPSTFPRWRLARDPVSAIFKKCIEEGYQITLPKKNAEGQTIVIVRPGAIDASGESYSPEDLIQSSAVIAKYINMDELVQINGIIFIVDFTNLNMKQVSFIGLEMIKQTMKQIKKVDTQRLRAIHCYNNGPLFDSLYALLGHLVSEKVKSRIVIHGRELEGLYKYIDKDLLPEEYLPDDYEGPCAGSIKSILSNFVESMSAPHVLDWFDRLHSVTGVDFALKPSDDEPQESFRKLTD
ncbi:hypothetical protein ScPMuIL_001021 [Solemya velum]